MIENLDDKIHTAVLPTDVPIGDKNLENNDDPPPTNPHLPIRSINTSEYGWCIQTNISQNQMPAKMPHMIDLRKQAAFAKLCQPPADKAI